MGWVVTSTPWPLYPRERDPDTLYAYRSLRGPRGWVGQLWKTSPQRGFEPWPAQPVACRWRSELCRPQCVNMSEPSANVHETRYIAQPLYRRSKYYVCLNSAIPKRKNDTTLENNGHAVSQLNTSWIPTASSCPGHEHDRGQECR